MRSFFLVILAVMFAFSLQADTRGIGPDLIIINANIHTLDTNKPTAAAVAILGNKISAIGSTQEIHALAGRETRVIDANGKLVLPGFNDAHVHFLMGGFSLANIDLRDAKSPQEFAKRLGDFAKKIPKGQWIIGGDWDHEKWPGTPLPTKKMVDALTPDNPIFVNRTDGHMALANSLALKLAGVTKVTKNIPGGLIVRDPNTGEATGIFKDAAMDLVERVIPEKSRAEKLVAAKAATEHAAKFGVTSAQDMSADNDIELYQGMSERGELKTRIYAVSSIMNWERRVKEVSRAQSGNDRVRVGGFKGFADGSLGSTTAYFFEPYRDAPKTRGLLGSQMFPEGAMLTRVLGADQAGWQIMIHAIGDQANEQILNIYKTVADKNGERDRRFRIEHAQHLRTNEIARFASQKVIASMQPFHAIDDGRWCEKRIGHERSKTTYAFRS
ncbi:MAG: amidohydrolase, partial [Verrucomicrobiota bacterium]|nr:amidohydrolase [Verrucomicrobiota bacterium]